MPDPPTPSSTSRRRSRTSTSSPPTASRRGARREGADWAEERARAFGALAGARRRSPGGSRPTSTRRCCAPTTATATASTRSSSTPLARADARRGRARLHALPVARAAARARTSRARRCSCCWTQVEAGVRLPDLDDLRGRAGAARAARAGRRVGAAAHLDDYDPRSAGDGKRGALCGMAMTEKQGGSDVRANTTAAPTPVGGRRVRARPATSGSARRRCATPSWCWRRPPARPVVLPRAALAPDGTRNASTSSG